MDTFLVLWDVNKNKQLFFALGKFCVVKNSYNFLLKWPLYLLNCSTHYKSVIRQQHTALRSLTKVFQIWTICHIIVIWFYYIVCIPVVLPHHTTTIKTLTSYHIMSNIRTLEAMTLCQKRGPVKEYIIGRFLPHKCCLL